MRVIGVQRPPGRKIRTAIRTGRAARTWTSLTLDDEQELRALFGAIDYEEAGA